MPQASDELRSEIEKEFGDTSDSGPYAFLVDFGYRETKGLWTRPNLSHIPTEKEMMCLQFLHDEWDYDYDAQNANSQSPSK
jgi:hypothetical protein